jgi:hypothetical protein
VGRWVHRSSGLNLRSALCFRIAGQLTKALEYSGLLCLSSGGAAVTGRVIIWEILAPSDGWPGSVNSGLFTDVKLYVLLKRLGCMVAVFWYIQMIFRVPGNNCSGWFGVQFALAFYYKSDASCGTSIWSSIWKLYFNNRLRLTISRLHQGILKVRIGHRSIFLYLQNKE